MSTQVGSARQRLASRPGKRVPAVLLVVVDRSKEAAVIRSDDADLLSCLGRGRLARAPGYWSDRSTRQLGSGEL